MTENMKTFIEKVVDDKNLWGKFGSSRSMEEAFSVANTIVENLSFEDFSSTMKRLNELEEKMKNSPMKIKENL